MPEPGPASLAGKVGAGSRASAPAGPHASSDIAPPLGILAGGGQFPFDIARAQLRRGKRVHIVALEGFADATGMAAFSHEWAGLGQVGRILSSFRRNGCRELIIAGTLQRPNLLRLKIDGGFVRHLPTVAKLTRGGDDSVLRRVVRFFEAEGFTVVGVPDAAPELLAPAGELASAVRSADHDRAVARASAVIRALGPFDVGQAVVATPDRVVAVESIRGTDAMLSELGPDGAGAGTARGGVLVKLTKPGQELRVDLPAIGPMTAERVRAAGLAGIAVGAGAAVVLERDGLRARADEAGLFVSGIVEGAPPASMQAPRPRWSPSDIAQLSPLVPLSRRVPTPSERRDITISRELIETIRCAGAGRATVVAREHALLVQGALPLVPLLAPLGRRSHWGLRFFCSQIGTLALDLTGLDDATVADGYSMDIFRAARDARLAGIVCLGRPVPERLIRDWAGWANDGKLFLMMEEA